MRTITNKTLPVSAIRESPQHWKRKVNEADIDDLADNIEIAGHINPITVRPVGKSKRMHELIAGSHRLRALIKMGKKTVDCRVIKCDDEDAKIISFSENLKIYRPDSVEWSRGVAALTAALEQKYADELSKLSKLKPEPEFPGPGPGNSEPKKAKRGRPETVKTKAIKKVAHVTGTNTRTVEKALSRHENLIASAQLALEREKITIAQADKLAKMSASKQKHELALMMKETREETNTRLVKETANTDGKQVKAAKKMIASVAKNAEALYDKAASVLDYMDDLEFETQEMGEEEIKTIQKCSGMLQALTDFLER